MTLGDMKKGFERSDGVAVLVRDRESREGIE